MIINLIDTLIDEKPIIDHESYRIHSNVLLSDVLGYDISKDKSELVDLSSYIDELANIRRRNTQERMNYNGTTYISYYTSSTNRDLWNKLVLPRFIISRKLLEFLMRESSLYIIGKLFSLDLEFISKHKDKVIESYKMIIDKFNYLVEYQDGYLLYGDKKSKIRYGKFIKMIEDIFYNESYVDMYSHRLKELEHSVDIYKSRFNTKGYRICVLNGKDILLGYNKYYQKRKSGTMLEQSCMNDKFDLLKIYTKNPDKVYLFVVTDEEGKIISRNLIWRLKKYNNFVFDRVYSIDNYISNAVKEMAEKENWIVYREGSGIQNVKKINQDGLVKELKNKKVKIKLSFKGIKYYPYLDTFKFQRKGFNVLTNKRINIFSYKYDQTQGIRTSFNIFGL